MANLPGNLYSLTEWGKTAVAPPWLDLPIEFKTATEGWLMSGLLDSAKTDTQPIAAEATDHKPGSEMRSFVDDFYNRILIEPGYIDIGNLVSDQSRPISVFNGYLTNKTLEQVLVSGGDGLSITLPALPAVWFPLQTVIIPLAILAEGPATIHAFLNFDWTGTVDDAVVEVVGARIVSLPYQAEAPLKETLEWSTDVMISNDGSEQRVRLRQSARQGFNMSYPVPPGEMARAQNIAYGWIGRKWAIPVWSQAQIVPNLISGDIVIPCDTDHFDFRAGGLVLIWASATKNEVIEIDSIDAASITLTRVLGNSYEAAAICPVYNGRVTGNIKRTTTGFQGYMQVNYNVTDNIDLASTAPPQYRGYDLYWTEQLLGDSGEITDDILTRVDVVDYETGPVEFYAPWTNNRIGRPFTFINYGPEESWTFREFIYRRAGKLRPFWLPTFENDLRLDMTGLVTSGLRVMADNYRGLGDARNHVGILLTDGSWHARAITGTSLDDAEHIIIGIDSPISVDASDIQMISFLGLKRFDTDRLEIDWPGNGISMSTIRMVEIKP